MKQIVVSFMLVCLAFGAGAADVATAVFNVNPPMSCDNCENKIKNNIRYEKGVKKVATSLANQAVTVTYDPSKTTPEQLAQGFEKIGYKATVTSSSTSSSKSSKAKKTSSKSKSDKSKGNSASSKSTCCSSETKPANAEGSCCKVESKSESKSTCGDCASKAESKSACGGCSGKSEANCPCCKSAANGNAAATCGSTNKSNTAKPEVNNAQGQVPPTNGNQPEPKSNKK